MRSISKALNKKSKSFLWILLAIFTTCVVLTSCIPKTDDDIIKLIEPVNASTGVRFNGTSFSFRGKPATEYELVIKNLNGDVVFLEPVVAQSETVTVTIPTKGKLRPNTTYRWYVRVKGSDAKTSDFWKFTTKENSAPSISNLQPNGLDGRPFGALALTWSATDADNDDLIFKVKVYEKGREIPQELEVSTDTCVVRNLKPTTEYTWTVVAQDPWGYRSEELTATFITKANEAPQLIELESPKDGATNVKFNNLTLQWKGSDPDYEDLKYSLTLKSTSESMNLVTDTSSTTFVVNDLKPATLYTLEITAKDSSGAKLTESFTFTTKENTFPAVPSLLEPSDGTKLNFAKLTTCTFKWSPSSDPDEDVVSYKFVIQLYDSGSSVIDVKPIGNTSYTVNLKNVLEVNKKYAWYVEAYDKHGGTSASQKLCFETYFNNPPSKPTDPTPAVGTTQPNRISSFSWLATDKDGDSLKYDIYIGDSPSNLRLEAQDLPVNYYSTTRLFDFSKTYYWKVVVKDGVNDPVDGDIWWFKITNEDRPPTAPELVSPTKEAKEVAFNNLQLKWKASTDNEDSQNKLTYYVYQGKADNMTLAATITGQTSSEIVYGISNLSPITTYYWRIEVKDTFGNYAYSTTWSFTTKANTAPSIPSNPNPANNSGSVQPGIVTLAWEASDPDGDMLSYDVYVNTTSDFSNISPVITNKPNCPFTVASGTTYFWKVVAKDPHGGEAKGPTWKFTVQ